MRFIVMVRADRNTEAGVMPTEQELAAMGSYNEELMKAGILLAGEGLHPSSKGARIRYSGGGLTTVTDGPFAETKELIGGYAIFRAGSKAEAIELGRQFLQVHADILGPEYVMEVEIREMFDPSGDGSLLPCATEQVLEAVSEPAL